MSTPAPQLQAPVTFSTAFEELGQRAAGISFEHVGGKVAPPGTRVCFVSGSGGGGFRNFHIA